MKLLSGFCVLLLLLSGCTNDQEQVDKIPENVLSEEDMVDVMVDLQLAESYVRNNRHNVDSIQPAAFYNKVWQDHHTSKEQVKESFLYYTTKPALMEQFYEEVINRLTEKQAKIEAEMEKNNEG